jgi:hypothetical protein
VAAELLNFGLGKNIANKQVTLIPKSRDIDANIGLHGMFLRRVQGLLSRALI